MLTSWNITFNTGKCVTIKWFWLVIFEDLKSLTTTDLKGKVIYVVWNNLKFNPFVPNAPFLYPLKTSENRKVLKFSKNKKKLGLFKIRTTLTILSFSKATSFDTSTIFHFDLIALLEKLSVPSNIWKILLFWQGIRSVRVIVYKTLPRNPSIITDSDILETEHTIEKNCFTGQNLVWSGSFIIRVPKRPIVFQ